jgi:hypothetical protein
LIASVPEDVDIHIVSKDGDFASSIDGTKPHPVLLKEWKSKNKADLYLHTELGVFLAGHFPDIKADIEKRNAVNRLKESRSFERTHAAISRLAEFADLLTATEVDELVEAAFENSQIHWIGTDPDVSAFFQKIVEPRLDKYPKERQAGIANVFGLSENEHQNEDDNDSNSNE